MKSSRYQIISAAGIPQLEEKVNAVLAEGWKCSGGVFLFQASEYHIEFAQAVCRKYRATLPEVAARLEPQEVTA